MKKLMIMLSVCLLVVCLGVGLTACGGAKTLAKPTLTVSGTTVSWSAVENAKDYTVNVDGTDKVTQTALSYDCAELTPGDHAIKVRANTNDSNKFKTSDWSETKTVAGKTLAAPTLEKAGTELKWTKVENALAAGDGGYTIKISQSGKPDVFKTTGVDCSYNQNDTHAQTSMNMLVDNVPGAYTFSVRANPDGDYLESGWSNTVSYDLYMTLSDFLTEIAKQEGNYTAKTTWDYDNGYIDYYEHKVDGNLSWGFEYGEDAEVLDYEWEGYFELLPGGTTRNQFSSNDGGVNWSTYLGISGEYNIFYQFYDFEDFFQYVDTTEFDSVGNTHTLTAPFADFDECEIIIQLDKVIANIVHTSGYIITIEFTSIGTTTVDKADFPMTLDLLFATIQDIEGRFTAIGTFFNGVDEWEQRIEVDGIWSYMHEVYTHLSSDTSDCYVKQLGDDDVEYWYRDDDEEFNNHGTGYNFNAYYNYEDMQWLKELTTAMFTNEGDVWTYNGGISEITSCVIEIKAGNSVVMDVEFAFGTSISHTITIGNPTIPPATGIYPEA